MAGRKGVSFILSSMVFALLLFPALPAPRLCAASSNSSQYTPQTFYWIGNGSPSLVGSGDWSSGPWSAGSYGSGINGTPGNTGPGDTANLWQTNNAAGTGYVTVTYDSPSSYALGSVSIMNSGAVNTAQSGGTPTGSGWIILDQTADMYTNNVTIGPLGAYKLESGTLTVKGPPNSTTGAGVLGIGGIQTDVDGSKTGTPQPYEGGLFYQTGGTVNAPLVSLGWNGNVNKPGMGIYALVNGALNVSSDSNSSADYSGGLFVGAGGQGNFFQGFGPAVPDSIDSVTGVVSLSSMKWTTGSGGTVTAGSLYLGVDDPVTATNPPTSATSFGKGDYELLYGSLVVNGNAYIGLESYGNKASKGDLEQGYFNPSNGDYTKGLIGDGTSAATIGGDLYLGLGGGSGSYDLYNGTLTVMGSSASGGIYVGFGGSGYSGFTQGEPYQDPTTGAWTTYSAYQDPATGAWKGNVVTAPNLYIGMSQTGNGAQYTLADGRLQVSGATYVGYSGSGGFSQGQWENDSNVTLLTSGGTFTTGSLYIGYGSGSSGNYQLASGRLVVTGDTYVGYNGTGYFSMGQPIGNGGPTSFAGWTYPTRDQVSQQTTNLYIGAGSNYSLYTGSLTVSNNTYVGYNGSGGMQGNFTQGGTAMWQYYSNGSATGPVYTSNPTDGGAFTTANLYIGGKPATDTAASSGNGSYTLLAGALQVGTLNPTTGAFTATGTTYVGYSGRGTFNQFGGSHTAAAIIVGAQGTYNYSGGTISGALTNKGALNISGAPATPNIFGASVSNNAFFSVNQANVVFADAVANNLNGIFNIMDSTVTFEGLVTNQGIWNIDPSTITLDDGYAGGGSLNFLGPGTDILNLNGNETIASLFIANGAILDITGGSLTVGPGAGAPTLSPGEWVENAGRFSSVPVPGAVWLLVPGLACLAGFRRRIGK